MNLLRKDTADNAISIMNQKVYYARNELNGYDCGINFLGTLGEVNNHQLSNCEVIMHFIWNGPVSEPKNWDDYIIYKPNILYDFNGSGRHYQNNDPRYLLPIGSNGLILSKIEFINPNCLLDKWISKQKQNIINYLNKFLYFNKIFRRKAQEDINNINIQLAKTATTIKIMPPGWRLPY